MMMPTSDFFNKFIKFHFHMVVLDIFGSFFFIKHGAKYFCINFCVK